MNSTTRIWTQDPLITRQALYHRARIATLSKMKPYNWVISSDGDPKIDLGSRKRKQLKKCYPPLTSQKWVSLSFQALILLKAGDYMAPIETLKDQCYYNDLFLLNDQR